MLIRALTGSERAYPLRNVKTLKACSTLAILYEAMKKWEDVEKLYPRSLVGYVKLYGSDHKWTLTAFINIGDCYINQGKLEQAEYVFVHAAKGFGGLLEKSTMQFDVWRYMLSAFRNFGSVYMKQDKLDEAEI